MRPFVLLALWSLAGTASAQALSVRIDDPSAGIVDGPVVTLHAKVSDPQATDATLVVNGVSYPVPIEQGAVSQQIVAIPGANRIAVVVEHRGQVAKDSLTFSYRGEPMELVVLVGWPSRREIIDLWVREPGGETCKWDHRATANGGALLDFSADAIGFGSQAYVLRQARPGRYRVKVHYWGSYGDDDARDAWTYDELIERLDELDAQLAGKPAAVKRKELGGERSLVIARLDAWASAGAPQTPIRGEAILFPGTRRERRFRFDVIVQRTGQLSGMGEIEIDAAQIAAARSER
ncbi:MAG TPA: hypothetical protein VK509_00275 [Polyangiales bacterium]|nr:hypothetical protein [Polyangiales bacterium]